MPITSEINKNKKAKKGKWPVQSRPREKTLELRRQENNLLTKLLGRRLLLANMVESRSHIDSDQVPSPYVKSASSKRAPSFSSENCPSKDSFVRLPKKSRPICASNRRLCWRYKRQLRRTWSGSSKILTCVLFTPNVSPSCPRTSSWLGVSAENVSDAFLHSKYCTYSTRSCNQRILL